MNESALLDVDGGPKKLPLDAVQRIELWDRALDRVRATLRKTGAREVMPERSMKDLVRRGSGPLFQVSRRQEVHLVAWCRPGGIGGSSEGPPSRSEGRTDVVLSDVEGVIASCFEAAGRPGPTRWRRLGFVDPANEALGAGRGGDENPPAPRAQVASARDGETRTGIHVRDPRGGGVETFVDGVRCARGHRDVDGAWVLAELDLDATLAVAEVEIPRTPAARIDHLPPLVALGLVDAAALPPLAEVEARLPVGITPVMRSVLARADDPIGRQFVPDKRELRVLPEERPDPIGDDRHTIGPGLIHRYADRVLLKPTLICAVYCRFCFRRDIVGDPEGATLAPDALAGALEMIRQRPQIWEVILTGGDPLVLSPGRIATIVAALSEIPHVRVIRIHTRVPLVAPERVTPALARALRGPKAVYVVLHVNHASEITPAGATACAAMIDAGIPMLSQSVLLRGVNDTPEALEALLRELVAHRIKPYYLHHPDLVEGTGHLRVPLEEGRRLTRGLRGRLSGLCQPVYVLDIPGGYGKVPAGAAWIDGPDADGGWRVTDPAGVEHSYRDV